MPQVREISNLIIRLQNQKLNCTSNIFIFMRLNCERRTDAFSERLFTFFFDKARIGKRRNPRANYVPTDYGLVIIIILHMQWCVGKRSHSSKVGEADLTNPRYGTNQELPFNPVSM